MKLLFFLLLSFCAFRGLSQPVFEWYRSYYPPGLHPEAVPSDFVKDSEGNIIASGYMVLDTAEQSLLTLVKYSSSGELIWNYAFAFSSDYPSVTKSVDVDSEGNIYATGYSNDTMITFKLDGNGELLWMNKYATAVYWNYGRDIKVVGDSTLIVLGEVENDRVVILCYDLDGNLIWERFQDKAFYFGFSYMRFDAESNIYICFEKYSPDDLMDVGICKYDLSGNLIYSYTYSSSELVAFAQDFEVTPDGTVYIISRSYNNDIHYELVKVSSAGEFEWMQYINNSGISDYFDLVSKIAVDNWNNVFIVGTDEDTYCEHDSLCIVKYSPDGIFQWKSATMRTECTTDWGFDIITDHYGNIYAISNNDGGDWESSRELLIIKCNPLGTVLWKEIFDDLTIPVSISVFENEIYILIYGSDSLADGTIGILKYTQDVTTDVLNDAESEILVFPNPASDYLILNFDFSEIESEIRTFDIQGRLVKLSDPQGGMISISNLPKGIYYTYIISGKEKKVLKWMKN